MLDASKLSKSFGARQVVSDVSFSIKAGEVVALLGPNGAGKSTTMKMIAGYLEPDAGDVRLNGTFHRRQPALGPGGAGLSA